MVREEFFFFFFLGGCEFCNASSHSDCIILFFFLPLLLSNVYVYIEIEFKKIYGRLCLYILSCFLLFHEICGM